MEAETPPVESPPDGDKTPDGLPIFKKKATPVSKTPDGLPILKKPDKPVDFTHGYQPTPEDIKTRQSYRDLQSGFDKSGNGSSPSQDSPGFRQFNPSQYKTVPNENPIDAMKRIAQEAKASKGTPVDLKKPHQLIRLLTKKEEDANFGGPVKMQNIDLSNADTELEAQQKAQDAIWSQQRAQEEKENPGSWSNALPEL